MIPAPLLEWAVWANLDRYQSLELILLKGHLLIEVVLLTYLDTHINPPLVETREMSFYRKMKEVEKHAASGSSQRLALLYVADLNTMRNKLAHEPFVNSISSQMVCWAENV